MPVPLALAMDAVAELAIPGDLGELRRASAWLEAACREGGVPAQQARRLDHCLEEALTNSITHGGTTVLSSVLRLRFGVLRSHGTCEAKVTLSDAGGPFNPATAPLGERPKTLDEARPGGLGLLMLRSFAEQLHYQRCERGLNHLTFSVSWAQAAGALMPYAAAR